MKKVFSSLWLIVLLPFGSLADSSVSVRVTKSARLFGNSLEVVYKKSGSARRHIISIAAGDPQTFSSTALTANAYLVEFKGANNNVFARGLVNSTSLSEDEKSREIWVEDTRRGLRGKILSLAVNGKTKVTTIQDAQSVEIGKIEEYIEDVYEEGQIHYKILNNEGGQEGIAVFYQDSKRLAVTLKNPELFPLELIFTHLICEIEPFNALFSQPEQAIEKQSYLKKILGVSGVAGFTAAILAGADRIYRFTNIFRPPAGKEADRESEQKFTPLNPSISYSNIPAPVLGKTLSSLTPGELAEVSRTSRRFRKLVLSQEHEKLDLTLGEKGVRIFREKQVKQLFDKDGIFKKTRAVVFPPILPKPVPEDSDDEEDDPVMDPTDREFSDSLRSIEMRGSTTGAGPVLGDIFQNANNLSYLHLHLFNSRLLEQVPSDPLQFLRIDRTWNSYPNNWSWRDAIIRFSQLRILLLPPSSEEGAEYNRFWELLPALPNLQVLGMALEQVTRMDFNLRRIAVKPGLPIENMRELRRLYLVYNHSTWHKYFAEFSGSYGSTSTVEQRTSKVKKRINQLLPNLEVIIVGKQYPEYSASLWAPFLDTKSTSEMEELD